MADEKASIILSDKVAPSIAVNIRAIANAAVNANSAVNKLQTALNSIQSNALRTLMQTTSQTTKAMSDAATASSKMAIANNNAAKSAAQLTAAQIRISTASNNAQAAAARLATAQARTQATAAQAAAAQDRAALAALRLQTAQDKANRSFKSGADAVSQYVTRLVSIAAVSAGAMSVIKLADSYTSLNNKLKVVTDSSEQANYLMEQIVDVANRSRTSLDATATAFTRFDRALKNMGASQEETLQMTETINKALVVGGATAQEASSSLLQLSQAFGSGRLQGDEFRSVSENMPIILQYLAKALNAPINQLKALSSESKITSQVMREAVAMMREDIEREFDKTQKTVGQATTILINNWTQFIGELGKSSGAMDAIANSIEYVAKHLDDMVKYAAIAGVALITYFGPSLLTMFSAATKAVRLFNAALLANPLTAIAVVLTSVISYLVLFGDELNAISGTIISVNDIIVGAFQVLADEISSVVSWFIEKWNIAVSYFEGAASEISDSAGNMFTGFVGYMNSIYDTVYNTVNKIIGFWAAAPDAIKIVWANFPAAIGLFFKSVVNAAIDVVEKLINVWTTGLRKVANLVSSFNEEAGTSINKALDNLTVDLSSYKFDLSSMEENLSGELKTATNNAINKDYLGEAGAKIADTVTDAFTTEWSKVQGKAQERAVNRLMDELSGTTPTVELRGTGKSMLGDLGDDKAAKKAAKEMEKLQKQLDRLRGSLDPVASASLNYQKDLELLNKSLAKGILTQDDYNKYVEQLKIKYEDLLAPVEKYISDIQKEMDAVKAITPEQKIQNEITEYANELKKKGISISDEQIAKMIEEKTKLQELTDVQKYLSELYQDSAENKLTQLEAQYKALNEALAKGYITNDQYSLSLVQMQVEMAKIKTAGDNVTASSFFTGALGSVISDSYTAIVELQGAFSSFYSDFVSGFSNAFAQAIVQGESFKESMRSLSESLLTNLASALMEIATKLLIIKAIESSSSSGSIIGSLGGLFGFESGGYTGNNATDAVAGVVHGQEFVMNAATTKRIGIDNLQRLQNGASLSSFASGGYVSPQTSSLQSGNSVGTSGVSVSIENYGTSKDFEVQRLSESEIRIIARDEAKSVVRTDSPTVVANSMNNTNSAMSKSMTSNFNVTRNRTS